MLAHLVGELYQGNLEEAVAAALRDVDGAYGLVFISSDEPGVLVAARKGSPLLVGVGENEWFVASDASPLLQYTRSVVYLDDGEMAVLTREGYRVRNLVTARISKEVNQIDWDLAQVERGGYAHFMLKEICEQPESLRNTLRGHLLEEEGTARVTGLNLTDDELKQFERVIITACGTSWHSGIIGEYMLEEMARLPVEVEYASEFRYRNPVVDPQTLVIGISQSGETADTLAAIREAKRRGARTIGLVNVVGSTIAREVDGGIYLHAGPEVGVASTKAFTSQVAALALISLRIARLRNLSILQGRQFIEALQTGCRTRWPRSWSAPARSSRWPTRFLRTTRNALYLGRGVNFPVALEGALKLKEISYIHAEGYPAAEMKHGPIALIDENMPVVFIAPRDAVHSKIVSNIEEVKARGGKVIALDQRGRHRDRAAGRRHLHHSGDAGPAHPDPHEHPAAAAVVLRRGESRLQCRPAAEPGQVGDGGVAGELITPPHPIVLGYSVKPPVFTGGFALVFYNAPPGWSRSIRHSRNRKRLAMRVVLQRVSRAAVRIHDRVVGEIGQGFCLLVGFTHGDTAAQVDWMAEKVAGLRLFTDADGKMNLGLDEVGGALLVVSQFTLYGDAAKGRRPSFIDAARPEVAIPLYQRFLAALRQRRLTVAAGEFGADMQVEISQRRTRDTHPRPRSMTAATLTLASSSPRRRQLLEMLGIPLRVVPSNIPEVRRSLETPMDYVERLAREKALSVPGELVLGADTTVVVRDAVLEKPVDAADALQMLKRLQGRTHQVVTSVALVAKEVVHQATDVTNVTFRRLDDAFLEAYVATGEPMDKAGAYGIQGYGAALIERIEGDFFSVMGLPLRLVLNLLGEAGGEYRFGK